MAYVTFSNPTGLDAVIHKATTFRRSEKGKKVEIGVAYKFEGDDLKEVKARCGSAVQDVTEKEAKDKKKYVIMDTKWNSKRGLPRSIKIAAEKKLAQAKAEVRDM